MKYKEVWDDLTRKMGYWVDLDKPYITFENGYIETCWYLLKELYKKIFCTKATPYSLTHRLPEQDSARMS